MVDSPALALQAAVVARLKATAGVAALVGARVHDVPPQGVVFPYIRMGRKISRPVRMSGPCRDDEVTFSVEGHSRPVAGRVEAERLGFAIEKALDDVAFTVPGYRLDWCRYITQAVEEAPDGRSYIVNVAFEAAISAA
jgi:hypothetical protein